ncbi:hypothetical protein [Pseudomonas sp. NPDC088890]|uniref:hypothetical protein n=1 Tax=Pseudomonas sp. NPDC088890 TaxID=3364458 RepID=UPI00384D8918
MGNRTHNAQLKGVIEFATQTGQSASSKQDLLHAVQAIRDFKGPLRFDNTLPWCLTLLLASLTLVVVGLCYQYPMQATTWAAKVTPDKAHLLLLAVIGGLLTLTVLSLRAIFKRANLLSGLSTDLARRSSLFSAGLSPIDSPPGLILEQLCEHFEDYQRGNHSRDITRALRGRYQGPLHSFEYAYYQLHYVVRRLEQEEVSDGKGGTRQQTRVVYDHHDRFSLVLDFPWIEGIAVRSGGPSAIDFEHKHQTSSTDFNRAFTLTGASAMACARFAKPVTVVHLLGLKPRFSQLNLEFSLNQGGLCISFDNSDLLGFQLPCDLHSPSEFYALIDAGVPLPALTQLLEAIHTLAEQHDDNFNLPRQATPHMEN